MQLIWHILEKKMHHNSYIDIIKDRHKGAAMNVMHSIFMAFMEPKVGPSMDRTVMCKPNLVMHPQVIIIECSYILLQSYTHIS